MATIGEWMPQPWRAISHGLHEIHSPVTVLNGGAVDDDEQHAARRVGDDMALAARNLLARVIATNATAFGGFDRPAVDHTGTGRRLSTGLRSTRRWLIDSHSPLSRQSWKWCCTVVESGGKHFGSMRH